MLVIRNIAELIAVHPGPVRVNAPNAIRRVPNATVGIDAGRIAWIRGGDEPVPSGAEVIDAGGGCVIPGLVDCHTHTVFAGTRESEFVERIRGRSYREIAEAGGGIRVTVEAVRRASVDELVELARPRLARMLAWGVTTVEIKSGYGLTVDDELKMLQAIKTLRAVQPVEIVATYLAAHTVPSEFSGRADAYIDEVTDNDLLKEIVAKKLASQADVFCERTAFGVDQSRRYLERCKAHGLTPRLHADQITQMGASKLAAEIGAASADHMEMVDDAGLSAMREAGTIGVLLPACSFFLGVQQAPARRIIDAGVPVAVATDFNPGSSMIESLPLTMSIACTQMRMTPDEVLVAATANAAAVLCRQDRLGALAEGMQADLVILDVPNFERLVYEAGRNCTRAVIKKGRVVYSAVD